MPVPTAELRVAGRSAKAWHLYDTNYRRPSSEWAIDCSAAGLVFLDALCLRIILGHGGRKRWACPAGEGKECLTKGPFKVHLF